MMAEPMGPMLPPPGATNSVLASWMASSEKLSPSMRSSDHQMAKHMLLSQTISSGMAQLLMAACLVHVHAVTSLIRWGCRSSRACTFCWRHAACTIHLEQDHNSHACTLTCCISLQHSLTAVSFGLFLLVIDNDQPA